MKNIILSLLSVITILLSLEGPSISAAPVCCQYYRRDTGFSCSGWHFEEASMCNTTSAQDYCGNVQGRARTSGTACTSY